MADFTNDGKAEGRGVILLRSARGIRTVGGSSHGHSYRPCWYSERGSPTQARSNILFDNKMKNRLAMERSGNGRMMSDLCLISYLDSRLVTYVVIKREHKSGCYP